MDVITMSMDGYADMNGTTWWHKSGNGRHFTIKDVMSDGSQMYAQTTDGQMINLTDMDNYIQSDTPIKPKPKVDPNMGHINLGNLDEASPVELVDNDDGMLPEDKAMLNGLTTGLEETAPVTKSIVQKSNNYDIIDKALGKFEAPGITVKLDWKKFPSREIELLCDIMGVSNEDVAKYCFTKYFDNHNEVILDAIRTDIESRNKKH